MKKIWINTIAILSIFYMNSCQKDIPQKVSFEANPDHMEIGLQDSVTFTYTGYADLISFYSGEKGREYQYRDRTEMEGLSMELSIASRVLYGSQEKNVKLMYSTAFSGNYSAAGIKEEEWTDISDKFTWSTAAVPNGIAATTTASGPADLSSLLVPGKPIYFAYRYESQAATSAATGGRSWRLPVFDLATKTPEGTRAVLATVRTAGWKIVPVLTGVNKASYWTISSSDPYLFFTPNSTLEPHIHWVITAPFAPTSVKPDKPLVQKAMIDPMPQRLTYRFTAPGTYKVTFVAQNVNYKGEETSVKQFDIKVNP
ncbi:DUF5017 domain-containing protein [Sphingobacterium spiritivorum]|uniref:DUF5017 domain-containing protein n=1 Tax=Sphingobacterium spiritivorum TaxID=258 RepID=UPI003DA4908C